MNPNEPQSYVTEPEGLANGRGPGRMLREARESLRMTVEQVAERLHLSQATVRALENDDYTGLPPAIFVRGYLKNMARLVGVDQQSVMDAFDRAIGRDGPLSSSDLAPAEAVAEPTRFAPALIGLMLAAFLGLGWWVYQSGSLQRAESENTASVPSDTSAADDPAAQEPGLQDVPEAVTNPHSAESGVAAVESPQPAVVPPAPDSTVQGSSQSVTLHFNGDSWVSVTDAEGTRLIYEMATKGGSRSVQGKAPFKLVLGRPADIALEYNGRQYDHGFTSNRVPARLTLGP